jgi:hypothetical protein
MGAFYRFRPAFAGAISLVERAKICQTPRPAAKPQAMVETFMKRWNYCLCLFALVAPLAGCAMWDAERWNVDRYRDERAVDIDQRLSSDEPIVKNPF